MLTLTLHSRLLGSAATLVDGNIYLHWTVGTVANHNALTVSELKIINASKIHDGGVVTLALERRAHGALP